MTSQATKASLGKPILPRYPLPSLRASVEGLLQATACVGDENDREQIRQAAVKFLEPDGIGVRLQARLAQLADNTSSGNWLADIYSNSMWLRDRHWHPRTRNYYASFPRGAFHHTQAERAALVTLTAYEYKKTIDNGTVMQDRHDDFGMPLCMESVNWIFNTNRTPVLGRDRVDCWPNNDYIIAMRNGHAYKIPLLKGDGQEVTQTELSAIFLKVLAETPTEDNWLSILTTANRDDWARIRDEVIVSSRDNAEYVSSIERSLFVVCLDNGTPSTPKERFVTFVLDDNRNRWLDKTMNFIVTTNAETALLCEHSKIDGTALYGLGRAIVNAITNHPECTDPGSDIVSPESLKYLPVCMPNYLSSFVSDLRNQHLSAVSGWTLCNYTYRGYGANYLSKRELPPKAIFQVIIQLAARRHYGYSPNSMDVVSQRHFQGGRVDALNPTTSDMISFCDAAWDARVGTQERRKLLSAAVRSYARLLSLLTWCRGWWRHTTWLKEIALECGEEVPELFTDPVYMRTKGPQKVYTTFMDAGVSEVGQCWPEREVVFMSVNVAGESVTFNIINGNGRGEEFVAYLEEAAKLVREIIEGPAKP